MPDAHNAFPSVEEIGGIISPRRLPYLQLAEDFDIAQTRHDVSTEAMQLGSSLSKFYLAVGECGVEPPLTEELTDLLNRAISVPVMDFRRFNWDTDELRNGSNDRVATRDNRSAARLLIRAILDHGQTAGVAHGQ